MSEEVISKEKLEERYSQIVIRTEETVTPFKGETKKRYVVDLIHDGSVYYVHIEFSPYGTTYSGDMGEFMFQPGYGIGTFKGSSINPGYWSQKINAAGREYYKRDFNTEKVDKAFHDEILAYYECEWFDEYFQEAKKAWKMPVKEFEDWYIRQTKKDLEEGDPDFADTVKKIYYASKPSDYMELDSQEQAYLATERAAKNAGLDWDFETVGDIAEAGIEEDYRFLYACCVLQWVANKIIKMGI